MNYEEYEFDTYWQKIISEIQILSKQVHGYRFSFEAIGGKVGVSRSAVWRMTLPFMHHEHLNEPKWSVGMALMDLHGRLIELSREVE